MYIPSCLTSQIEERCQNITYSEAGGTAGRRAPDQSVKPSNIPCVNPSVRLSDGSAVVRNADRPSKKDRRVRQRHRSVIRSFLCLSRAVLQRLQTDTDANTRAGSAEIAVFCKICMLRSDVNRVSRKRLPALVTAVYIAFSAELCDIVV